MSIATLLAFAVFLFTQNKRGEIVPHALWVVPFVVILLVIAIFPMIKRTAHWWERNSNKLLVSCVLGVPVAIAVAISDPSRLIHTGLEYFQFLSLLASLFFIAGGIHLSVNIRATPKANVLLLGVGFVLASLVGTTGASMLMIYPILKTNDERHNNVHTVIFFIFLVCNGGGMLTPIGDPPLFLAYLKGVDFFWFLRLFPMWVFIGAILLGFYFVIDTWQYRKETESDIKRDNTRIECPKLYGSWNMLFLFMIPCVVALKIPTPYREMIMWGAVGSSIAYQKCGNSAKEARELNGFSLNPIFEVATVFIGIFITMIPALALLEERGAELGFSSPAQFFFATGVFSSFLDNAPTFLVFLALGQATMGESEVVGMMTGEPSVVLAAVASGAVLFGAMTYIGNAPNFMIRSIAEERRISMPSFFGYMLWSAILIPVYWFSMYLFLEVLRFPLW